jgi:hypothetical protein
MDYCPHDNAWTIAHMAIHGLFTDNNKKDRTTYDIENPGPGIALLT